MEKLHGQWIINGTLWTDYANDSARDAIANPDDGMIVRTLHDCKLNVWNSVFGFWRKINSDSIEMVDNDDMRDAYEPKYDSLILITKHDHNFNIYIASANVWNKVGMGQPMLVQYSDGTNKIQDVVDIRFSPSDFVISTPFPSRASITINSSKLEKTFPQLKDSPGTYVTKPDYLISVNETASGLKYTPNYFRVYNNVSDLPTTNVNDGTSAVVINDNYWIYRYKSVLNGWEKFPSSILITQTFKKEQTYTSISDYQLFLNVEIFLGGVTVLYSSLYITNLSSSSNSYIRLSDISSGNIIQDLEISANETAVYDLRNLKSINIFVKGDNFLTRYTCQGS